MKRLVTLLLAAGLMLGATNVAQAADIKVSGIWEFQFSSTEASFMKDHGVTGPFDGPFDAMQRLRSQIEVVASENLKGVIAFELGTDYWGTGGYNYGARPNNDIKLRFSYVDWVVPNTNVKVRMGKQPFALPGYAFNSTIMNRNGSGIIVSSMFSDNLGLTFGWLRAEDDNTAFAHDTMDLFIASVPMNFDGITATPFAVVGLAGQNSLSNTNNDQGWSPITTNMLGYQAGYVGGSQLVGDEETAVPWWVGFASQISMFDPFSVALDAAYGSIDMGTNGIYDIKRSGWYVAALAEYKMAMMTPGLGAWYGSGDDDDATNGSERMPSLQALFNPTTLGFDGFTYEGGDAVSQRANGTWGVLAQLKDISFMEDLKHTFRVAYYQGTNDKDAVGKQAFSFGNSYSWGADSNAYLTTGDSAFEANFNTYYDIYENLSLAVELAYVYVDVDKNVWETSNLEDNAYKAAVNMQYKF